MLKHALFSLLLLLIVLPAFTLQTQGASPEVRLLTIDGVINPLTARYLDWGLQEAAEAQAKVVIVRLNTPGGLESSMREMTQAMLNSPVPVVVFVAPPGARAASAGMFITLAAHVAAMAPGTNIGAAHPVGLGEQTDPVMAEKLVNDAAALARSLATTRGIAITTLRAVVGDMLLDEVLSRREDINEALRGKLDEVTNRWGIKVTAVEIREIIPPREIQEAMTRQMSAERSRRATVTEADGRRDAAIRVAEGQRQATILEAEGRRQATILEAEGERQAAILRAEGSATALNTIFNVARTVESNTMSLQYLDAIKALGAAPATKFVVPLEFTNLLRPFLDHTGRSTEEQ